MFWITYTVTRVVLTNNDHWLIPTQCHKDWQRNRTSRNSTPACWNFRRQLKWTTRTRTTVRWHVLCSDESKFAELVNNPRGQRFEMNDLISYSGVLKTLYLKIESDHESPARYFLPAFLLISRSYFSFQVDVFKEGSEVVEDAEKKYWIGFFCSLWISTGM